LTLVAKAFSLALLRPRIGFDKRRGIFVSRSLVSDAGEKENHSAAGLRRAAPPLWRSKGDNLAHGRSDLKDQCNDSVSRAVKVNTPSMTLV
jgi:hypothetical protein